MGNAIAVVSILVALPACSGESLQLPTSPTSVATSPQVPAPAPAPPRPAISIALGQVVSGVVSQSDPACGPELGTVAEPCQLFTITPPAAGVLIVEVVSPGPSGLTLGIGPRSYWGTTASVIGEYSVVAGQPVQVSVSLHYLAGGRTSQSFELRTSLH